MKLLKAKIYLILAEVGAVLILAYMLFVILAAIFTAVTSEQARKANDCGIKKSTDTQVTVATGNETVESFVSEHEEAYILSWKAGGYLPSFSIAQTFVEYGFNFTNPSGTNFWLAHNMGGVKTGGSIDNFPITLETYGKDAVDLSGTKLGTNVGDNTGGNYAWFKSYDAGIVAKSEFMAHQTLYKGAINNTEPREISKAIAQGGWASDPVAYENSLNEAYDRVGSKFKWLDEKAIKNKIEKTNYLYVGGGNTFYLLQELKRKNLIDFIKNRVNFGMTYIGESAGAIITSKDIEYNDLMDDKTIAKDLKEYSGLNLVDFYIVPHLNEFPFEESSKQTVEKYKDKLNIIAINNSQAIILKDEKFEIR